MAKRFAHTLCIYTFVVFMVLLRPYLAYQISMQGSQLSRDPDQVSRLFQRLVKKKESHIDDNDEAMELVSTSDIEIVLPVVLLLVLRRRLTWLLALLNEAIVNWRRSAISQVFPPANYLALISRLQV